MCVPRIRCALCGLGTHRTSEAGHARSAPLWHAARVPRPFGAVRERKHPRDHPPSLTTTVTHEEEHEECVVSQLALQASSVHFATQVVFALSQFSTQVENCDSAKTTCVAKCTDDACKASCETTHSSCSSSCVTVVVKDGG